MLVGVSLDFSPAGVLTLPVAFVSSLGQPDGFFRISNVPAGRHKVVAWTPGSKQVIS